jgi:hypothetical protein
VHGSLLVMAGDTQRRYQHQVQKTLAAAGERINLTFRCIQVAPVGDARPTRRGSLRGRA